MFPIDIDGFLNVVTCQAIKFPVADIQGRADDLVQFVIVCDIYSEMSQSFFIAFFNSLGGIKERSVQIKQHTFFVTQSVHLCVWLFG